VKKSSAQLLESGITECLGGPGEPEVQSNQADLSIKRVKSNKRNI